MVRSACSASVASQLLLLLRSCSAPDPQLVHACAAPSHLAKKLSVFLLDHSTEAACYLSIDLILACTHKLRVCMFIF